LNNWWTEADREAFKTLTEKLVDQFSAFEPLPGKRVDGQLTLGENIADLSGLAIAFKALKLDMKVQPQSDIAGWTPEQLFFVGWSRVWQRKYRDAEMVKRLLTDPHSPSRYRANGPVTNIDAFYQAFKLKDGDALFRPPADRIKIW
jgi:predicted metalloendopeptidase